MRTEEQDEKDDDKYIFAFTGPRFNLWTLTGQRFPHVSAS
jgi:hypothetical protein